MSAKIENPESSSINPIGLTHARFVERCAGIGIGSGKATTVYSGVFREGKIDGLPPGVCAQIAPVVKEHEEPCNEGVTLKFCQQLDRVQSRSQRAATVREWSSSSQSSKTAHSHSRLVDTPFEIESVIIPMVGSTGRKTHTLCLSSQVGCAMGCTFCETAQMGLVRQLTPAEIVGQWWAARHLKQTHIDNIVFMGMGEPLDNLDAVLGAIEILTDRRGAGLAMASITISTVGRVDGLRRLVEIVQKQGWKRLGIALSVNAPSDAVRREIMPVGRKWDMGELREVMLEFVRVRPKRKIMFEYVLIPGVNSNREHARQLGAWMAPFVRTNTQQHIGLLNIIPYNPRRDSPWPAPSEQQVAVFVGWMKEEGVYVKRRITKGRSQMAACGQLGNAEIRKRKFVGLTTGKRENKNE